MVSTIQTTGVDNILAQYVNAGRDKLIPILQEVQEELGFLSKEAVVQVGEALNLPVSKIYGVATFYNQFRFKPLGKYHIQICRGTACHVKGSESIVTALENLLDVPTGDTSKDGLFSTEVVACIGACGLAPIIAINNEFHAYVDSSNVKKIIRTYKKKEK
ncbi:MAG: NADH-quinone oxidoreductase subunit NuoE [Fibrobacterales bacterium]